ncbi:hypothetical protein [Sulfitobacter sediminis]
MIVAETGPNPVTVVGGLGTIVTVGKPVPVKDGPGTPWTFAAGDVPVNVWGRKGCRTMVGCCPVPVKDGVCWVCNGGTGEVPVNT